MEREDISIGQDQWIEWVDVLNKQDTAMNIDSLVDYTQPLWRQLETQCIAECCGLDAYNFWPDQLAKLQGVDTTDLKRRLAQIRQQIQQSPAQVLVSDTLNHYVDKGVFLQLLDHISAHL